MDAVIARRRRRLFDINIHEWGLKRFKYTVLHVLRDMKTRSCSLLNQTPR